MSGVPLKNKPLFDLAQKYLESKGYDVNNPAAKPNEILDREATEDEYLSFMKEDVFAILYKEGGVNEIWTLPDWWNSKGARFEILIGQFFKLPIQHLDMEELNEFKKKKRIR